ncbi:XPG N-terminal domain-containing protein [Helicostylum pulchrum]|nr:XPG N-terminal domain-containing protein [Helicostylum pulchrum]
MYFFPQLLNSCIFFFLVFLYFKKLYTHKMGVQGLWSLLGPVARPTRLESLRNKRIGVDASIWIHQFMRTMRDNEGNELRNGHLLGFFRRLCKLLFFDIKPVFVFDGGAPTLKRITIVSIFFLAVK